MSRKRKLAVLVARQRSRCYLCHKTIRKPTVDHVYPKSKGGSSRMDNLAAACWICNNQKSDIPLPVYRRLQKEKAA